MNKILAAAVVKTRLDRADLAASRGHAIVSRVAVAQNLVAENLALRRRWAQARAALMALRITPQSPNVVDSSDTDSVETASSQLQPLQLRKEEELFETPLYPCLDTATTISSSEDRWAEMSPRLSAAVAACGEKYADAFANSYRWLLAGPGPLPHSLRLNLAILGAAEVGSSRYATELAAAWTEVGGNEDWLQRPQTSPAAAFGPLASALAARPPRVHPYHYTELECGGWSAAEVAQAMLILAHFQAMPLLLLGNTSSEKEEWSYEEDVAEDEFTWECPVMLTAEEYCWEDAECLIEALLDATANLSVRRNIAPKEPSVASRVFGLYGYRALPVNVGGSVGVAEQTSRHLFQRAVVCPSSLTVDDQQKLNSSISPTDWVVAWEARVEGSVIASCKALTEALLDPATR